MKVKPKRSYYLAPMMNAKFPYALKKGRAYKAVPATNQPNWKKKGKIFVGEILLEKGEYTKVKPR